MNASITITDERRDYFGIAQRIELVVIGDYEPPEPNHGLPEGVLDVQSVKVGGVDIYPLLGWDQVQHIAQAACDELDKLALTRRHAEAA